MFAQNFKKHGNCSWPVYATIIFEKISLRLNVVRSTKMGEFCSFSRLNISVIVDDGASFLITDMYKLLYCLSKKCLFNDLELQCQGQMAHVSSIALFSPEIATRLHSKTFKTSMK